MSIRRTLTWKRFYLGGLLRIQQVVDAMNGSPKEYVEERKTALSQVTKLSNWLDRPYPEPKLAGLDYDYDL